MMVVARLTAFRGHELRTLKWDCVKLGNGPKFKILSQFDKAKKGKESVITPVKDTFIIIGTNRKKLLMD